MEEYNQDDIDQLISCPKTILEPPKRELKLVGADWRNDMVLAASSNDLKGRFPVFIRKNEDFPENFSIGLRYVPRDDRGEIILLRCNGPHGNYNGTEYDARHPHWDYHVHKATQGALAAGKRAESFAEKTSRYASFEEALPFFLAAINLASSDIEKHFPQSSQAGLFGEHYE